MPSQRNGAHAICCPSAVIDDRPSPEQLEAALTHVPALQTKPVEHGDASEQVVRHPDGAHAYGTHAEASGALQLPAPSQADAPTKELPSQRAGAQLVVGPAAKPPHVLRDAPSHARASHALAPASHGVRPVCGAPTTGEQAPMLPATSHASH